MSSMLAPMVLGLAASVNQGFAEVEDEIRTIRGITAASTAMSSLDFGHKEGYQLGFSAIVEQDRYNAGFGAGIGYRSDDVLSSLRVGVAENGEMVGGVSFTISLGD